MKRRWAVAMVVLAAAAGLLFAGRWWRDWRLAQGSIDWAVFADQRPWLSEVSAWSEEVHLDKAPARRDELGCYPLGNGHVFTTLGLRLPLNTLENTIGPSYQKQQGFLGQWSAGLEVNGRPVPLPAQRVLRVAESGVVRATCGSDTAVLDTYDFVPPACDLIARIIAVKNTARRPQRINAVVYVRGLPPVEGRPAAFERGTIRVLPSVSRGTLRWRTATSEVGPQAVPQAEAVGVTGADLVVPFGRVPPAQSRAKLLLVAIARGPTEAQAALQKAQAAGYGLLDATRRWWQSYADGCARVECEDKRTGDLLSDEALLIQTQQALPGGGFSPMYQYTYCWARDSNGPIRYLLACGKFEEVKRALDFYYEASARKQQIRMNYALDLEVSGPSPEVDWTKTPAEPAEAPSFLVLQHYWYWKYSGDAQPIRAHWEYLRRCLEGQDVTPDLRLPFNGDETYRFPGYSFFEKTQQQPSDYVSLHLYSADSAFEYVKAAEALAEMAPVAGRSEEAQSLAQRAASVRQATERYYWQPEHRFYAPAMSRFSGERYQYPFANIVLNPIWVGYASGDDPRARQNAINCLRYLWREDGTADTTPSFGYAVGLTPGIVLYSLAAIDHPDAARAFQGTLAAFSPSGDMSEMLTPKNRPAAESDPWGKTRARPWEGGLNAEALLYYLTGFEPDAPHEQVGLKPHLPPGQTRMTVRGLRVGAELLDLSVTDEAGRAFYSVSHHGSRRLTVDFVASLPASQVTAVLLAGTQLRPPEVGDNGLGRTQVSLRFRLEANNTTRISIRHEPTSAQAARLQRIPFRYLPPSIGSADVVLVTGDEEIAGRWRHPPSQAKGPASAGRRLFLVDSEIAFPPEYLEAALLDAGGRRRVAELILDVSAYPGAFKTPAWWESGPGAKILKRFEAAGGKVTRVKGSPKAPPPLGREGSGGL